MAKRIPITAEYVRSRLDYDPDTGVLRWKARPVRCRIDRMWNTRFAGTVVSHKNSTGHIMLGLDGKGHLAHRIAWLIVYGDCPPLIDHKNGVRDDNRLCNLRAATRSQNNSNTTMYRNNKSGFRGVSRQYRGWTARIGYQGTYRHLGTFETSEDAARAYDKAARILHGEFATLNFP